LTTLNLSTGFANTVRNTVHMSTEATQLRSLGAALVPYPMLVGFNRWVPRPQDTSTVLILSHYSPDKYAFVKPGSDWMTAWPIDPDDFSQVAGISGHDRRWRASILVDGDVDLRDDSVKRGLTRYGSEEFDFPYPIDSRHILWTATNW